MCAFEFCKMFDVIMIEVDDEEGGNLTIVVQIEAG